MDVGIALPSMAPGWTRATFVDWCRGIDQGPFSSLSGGERVTFHNPELLTSMAAAAALTEHVELITNVVVAPWHSAALLAKQLATIDLIADGRLTVGVGVGGREQDYAAVGSSFARRHQRLDEQVARLRELWAGEPATEGAPPTGPAPRREGGPPILASPLGPRSMARAARWADGITGFSFNGDQREVSDLFDLARRTWTDAGRTEPPRLVTGAFYVLAGRDRDSNGGSDNNDTAADTLRTFTAEYLAVFGRRFASEIAAGVELSSAAALTTMLDRVAQTGCDEVILVPGTTDVGCLHRTAEVVASWSADRR